VKMSDPVLMAAALENHYKVPAHLVPGLVRYLHDRIEPGSFLGAVLRNDLRGAVRRMATLESMDALHALVLFLDNEVSQRSYGSPEKVAKWLSHTEND